MDERLGKITWRALGGLAAVYGLSHALLYAAGVRFDAGTLPVYMHFLDPELLRTRLLESCWYLHIQPPFFNLFLGLVLKLGPALSTAAFHACYLALGFALYTATCALQLRLAVPPWLAFTLATAFMISPPRILAEHWLFYTFPCAALLTFSALFLHRFLAEGKRRDLWAFFAMLFLLAGTRTVFHLLWLFVIAAALTVACSGQRKRVLAAAAVVLVLAGSLYAKNYFVFGKFTLCTWSGKHLWIKTVGNLNVAERQRLVEEGALSEISKLDLNRFEATQFYPERYVNVQGFEDIPALRQLNKSSAEINYNHLAQIGISEQYGKDARFALLRYPKTFALTTVQAALIYFQSNSGWAADSENYKAIQPWVWLYDRLAYGKLPFDLFAWAPALGKWVRPQYLFLMLGLPLVWLGGLYAAARGAVAGRRLTRAERITIAYLCFNILFVFAVGSLLEMLETARFRFMTDPFSAVLLGLCCAGVPRRQPAVTPPRN